MANSQVPPRVFHVGVEDLEEAAIVTISGEVDAANVPAVRRPLEQWAAAGRGHFVVDLRRVEYLDSLGITMLAQSFDAARAAGSTVAVVCGERTADLLESLGLGADVSIVRSRDQALSAAEGRPESQTDLESITEDQMALRAARKVVESGRVSPDDSQLQLLQRALEEAELREGT
jgi:anti-anti-sigma factor